MTIHDRLDPITLGITSKDLTRYERESETFATLLKNIQKPDSSYLNAMELIALLDVWHGANSYRLSSDDIILQKLKILGVTPTLKQIKPPVHDEITPLGQYLMEVKSAFVSEHYNDYVEIRPDSDGDINRNTLHKFLQGTKSSYDIFFILDGLASSKVTAEENPSPPMRAKLG